MNHEEAFELIPEYSLGSLQTGKLEIFKGHLENCKVCQSEAQLYLQMISEFSLLVPIVVPPVLLKPLILSQSSRQPVNNKQNLGSKLTNIYLSFKAISPVLAFSSLALILILFITNIWLWQRVNKTLEKNEFHLVSLEGTDFAPDASGLIVINNDGKDGTLVVSHLPALDMQQQYQLWLIRDQQRTNGGVFSVDEEGYASLSITSEAPLSGFNGFGITIEPYGGSPGPTGEKVLGGDL